MFVHSISHYIPTKVLDNAYFSELTGLSNEELFKKSGIITRRVVNEGENTNTMALEAVANAFEKSPIPANEINLIVGGTYSPYDTVGTLAHIVQEKYKIDKAKVVSVSSACSTFINAMELVQGYFAMNKASKAIVVVSEHNSAYYNEKNPISGHLWGDGAAALIVSKNRISENDLQVIDIYTEGLGHIGKGPEGVYLRPFDGGIQMPDGRNVFIHASKYMSQITKDILEKNGYSLNDLTFLVPHQANIRIIETVANILELKREQTLINITELGNTGCASSAIALSQNTEKYKSGNIMVATVFGGGYSCGAMLLKKI
ncbi:MAG: ketoacyl-ACP synthase III [Bacteroidales bacterium]|nr:ketoacyl-ACP synthase III [Bacteroidales bacterium]